jgi:preprotein translocase subunit YajC
MKRLALGLALFNIAPVVFADVTTPDMGSNALSQGLMLAAFVAIFYFFVLRPQSKRAKEHRDLVTKLSKGDEVITSGGIVAKINRVADDFFVLTIAPGVEVVVQKQSISGVLPKGSLSKI